MAVEVILTDTNGTIGEVIDYSVQEDATPLVVGDSSGSVGQLTINAKGITTGPVGRRSGATVGASVTLNDTQSIDGTAVTGHGSIEGQVTRTNLPGERASLSAETVLNRLNTDRKADPFYGSFIPAQTTTTVRTNISTNPSREVNVAGLTVDTGSGGNTGNASITRATEVNYTGYFGRVTYTSNGAAIGGGFYETVNVAGGTAYSLSGQYRVTRATALPNGAVAQRLRFIMRFYTSANAVLNDIQTTGPVLQGQWTQFTVSAVAPQNAAYARIYTIAEAAGTLWKIGDTIDSDYVIVQAGAGGDYFDGSTPTSDTTDPYTGIRTVKTYAWTGTAGASTSIETTAITTPASGYDATQGNAFRYYCQLVDIHNVVVDPEFENRPVAYPGWEGNVWTYLKQFAAAVRGEIALVNGVVTLRKPRLVTVPVESISGPVIAIDSTLSAQFVDVVNQDTRWGTDEVALKSGTVYSVDSNAYVEAKVSVPHFLGKVNNPEPVLAYNIDYDAGPGQYAILDSQGLAVTPEWWNTNGGRIEVKMSYESYQEIVIGIYGPRADSKAYIGPFKLGRFITPNYTDAQGEVGAAMDITGSGVFVAPKTIRIRTGVSEDQTSTIAASVINNPFLTTAADAYTRGLDAACVAAGPVVRLTGAINSFPGGGQHFGTLAGGRIRYGDNIFRISSTTFTRGGVNFTAEADMTFSDLVDLYSYTFGELNATYPGISFQQFNILQGSISFEAFNDAAGTPVFGDFNAVFKGASFNDHTVYPYTSEVTVG